MLHVITGQDQSSVPAKRKPYTSGESYERTQDTKEKGNNGEVGSEWVSPLATVCHEEGWRSNIVFTLPE